MHAVHVGVDVFARCLGIMLCCAIFLRFMKEICTNRWWCQSKSEAAVLVCLSSSSFITIYGGLSSLVGTFSLNVMVV